MWSEAVLELTSKVDEGPSTGPSRYCRRGWSRSRCLAHACTLGRGCATTRTREDFTWRSDQCRINGACNNKKNHSKWAAMSPTLPHVQSWASTKNIAVLQLTLPVSLSIHMERTTRAAKDGSMNRSLEASNELRQERLPERTAKGTPRGTSVGTNERASEQTSGSRSEL